jgi:hypothetical protein
MAKDCIGTIENDRSAVNNCTRQCQIFKSGAPTCFIRYNCELVGIIEELLMGYSRIDCIRGTKPACQVPGRGTQFCGCTEITG